MRRILRAVIRYLTFFLLVAFLVTCCVTLFTVTLTESLGVTLTGENLNTAAKLTFANVIGLILLFMFIDVLRRKMTVERSVRSITDAARKMVAGDFSVRVNRVSKFGYDESFNEIIDCFNQMAQELAGVETLRTDFISNVSHEMKTPLAVIQNYGTLLQAPDLSEEKRMEFAQGVTNGSRRLADMVTNILKLNKLENQKIYPNTEEYDLGEQLCESLLQYENIWEEKGIEIETDIAEGISVYADRELLALVWNNLLSNAFKFTPKGRTVFISMKASNDDVIVKVQDTGCGMSAETGSHIFDIFYQGDTSHAAQGNGLGLALVKRVVDILHGQISVESALGKGTAFTVTLGRKG